VRVHWHSGPGQIKQDTPPCDEQVPLRFCEQLYVLSLQTAVAVPHEAEIGVGTVQMFEPAGGDGGVVGLGEGVGVGLGVGVGVGAGLGVGDGVGVDVAGLTIVMCALPVTL
jgi:hypothetical protein